MFTDVNALTEDQFNDWLRAQPDDRPLEFEDTQACVGYSFLNDSGVDVYSYGVRGYEDSNSGYHVAPEWLGDAVSAAIYVVTYGQLKQARGL